MAGAGTKPPLTRSRKLLYLLDGMIIVCLLAALATALVPDDDAMCRPADAAAADTVRVTLSSDTFGQDNLSLRRCDKLIIKNTGRQSYSLRFGPHARPIDYDGLRPAVLTPGGEQTIMLTKAGNYTLHDHMANIAKLPVRVIE